MKPKRQLVPPVNWMIAAMLALVLFAILKTSLMEVRSGGRVRSVDSMNLRQIAQAALIYANENDDRLPEINLGPDGIPVEGESTTVHRYAMALTRKTDLNTIDIFISPSDRHPGVKQRLRNHTIVLGHQGDEANSINPAFLESGISYQLIGGLKMGDPSTTPVAFTRGLQQEGEWDPESGVHGSQGGHIVYLGGNVRWHKDLQSEFGQLTSTSGEPTSNILETLSPDQAVYGDPDPPIPDGTRGVGTIAESPAK